MTANKGNLQQLICTPLPSHNNQSSANLLITLLANLLSQLWDRHAPWESQNLDYHISIPGNSYVWVPAVAATHLPLEWTYEGPSLGTKASDNLFVITQCQGLQFIIMHCIFHSVAMVECRRVPKIAVQGRTFTDTLRCLVYSAINLTQHNHRHLFGSSALYYSLITT